MKDNIYIIGAGAIGKALAVFLKEENKNPILIRGSVDNQPEKINSIIVTNQANVEFRQEILTTTLSNLSEINGVVLIATKTFANHTLAQKLIDKAGDFSIVLLQNGMNIEHAFSAFPEVYRCVLFTTSQLTKENHITFKTVTASPVGPINNSNTTADDIVALINTEQFSFRSESDIDKYIWEKVIINCAYNSICPLLEIDNGIFHRNEQVNNLAKEIISECVVLASAYGLKLDQSAIEEKLLYISQRADGQLISTYEDIRKKRRTEIDSLNLEIARMADEINKPLLVLRTRLLGQLIAIKSEMTRM